MALGVASTTAPASASPTATVGHSSGSTADQFVKRSGSWLTLGGLPFRFSGTNNYYLEYAEPVMTDAVLAKAEASGSTVMRTWAFFDVPSATDAGDKGVYFQYWDQAAGRPAYNDGPDGLERLDHVVAQAKAEGVRLILPLTNNWYTFGGMDQYNAWAGSTYHSDFYTDPVIRGWYKDWVTHVLNRVNTETGIAYKDDPTIMAWELANEPRCVGSGGKGEPSPGVFTLDPSCSVATLTPWVDEMSRHIKSIDAKHLVGTGDEGFLADQPASDDWTHNGSEGVDAAAFAALPGIDYVSYHLYPDHWSKTYDWGRQWIADHSRIGRQVHKPSILGEYGVQDKAQRNATYKSWLDTFRFTGGTGALFWILSDVQGDGTLYPDYDGFTVYADSPVSLTLKNFSTQMRRGWGTFPPVADDDLAVTDYATPVVVPLTGNDIAYLTAVNPRTVDLDVAARGQQTSVSTAAGAWSVDRAGSLTFAPADGFTGRASATYQVRDRFWRMSNTATVTVTVKPSPTAAQVLFDFADGAQGWALADFESPAGSSAVAVDGHLEITTPGKWFGTALAEPLDLSKRTQLRFDLLETAGTGPSLALKVGPGWTWCQPANPPYVNTGDTPLAGDNAVTFDLTTLSADCAAGLDQVHAMYLYVNGGRHLIDNVLVN